MASRMVGFDFTPAIASDPLPSTDTLPFPLARRTTHRWTDERRTVLLALNRWFTSPEGEISAADRRTILCQYFEHSLLDQEGMGKLTKDAVTAQLYEIFMKYGSRSGPWRRVYEESEFEDSTGWFADTRLRIRHIARAHGIDIVSREFEDIEMIYRSAGSKNTPTSKKRRQATDIDSDEEEEFDRGSYDSGDERYFGSGQGRKTPRTPRVNRHLANALTAAQQHRPNIPRPESPTPATSARLPTVYGRTLTKLGRPPCISFQRFQFAHEV